MGILEELKDQGWYLTQDGLKKLPDNTDSKKIITAALDIDFREIGGGALPLELTRKDETLPGRIVLQIQKIRNISAPKANEESRAAPRFLQIELTDGVTVMQALELEHIATLSLNTPPGTKIYFKCQQIPLMQGMIILKVADVQILGGKVTALVEKWEMTRSLQKYAKSGRLQTGSSGPPPWIPFGQKLQQNVGADKNFKSLVQSDKEKEGKENDEFNAMRSEAIAEAARAGAKKIFGGGNHQILDHNVKKILEKGYTEEEAKNALRATGNSLERALYNLKRRGDDYRNREEKSKTLPLSGKRGPKEFGKRVKEVEVIAAAKPAGNVSLFDFLTDKLPANAEQAVSIAQPSATNLSTTTNPFRQDNNYVRSMTKSGSEPSSKAINSFPGTNSTSQSYHDRRTNQDNAKSYDQGKFENNISSSFATRNTSHMQDERTMRYSSSNRGRGGGNPFHGKLNPHFDENSERHQRDQRNSSVYSSGRGGRSSHERSTANFKHAGNSKRGGASQNSGFDSRRQNDYQSQKEAQNQQRPEQTKRQDQRNEVDQKGSNGKKPVSSRYQIDKDPSCNSGNARNYDNRQVSYPQSLSNQNQNQTQNENNNSRNNNDHSTKMNKLLESTSKLKIDKTRSGQSPNSQQQPGKTQQQTSLVNPSTTQRLQQTFGPLPNGFNYDPNKIIGFQSKETNEFALTLLKSQGIPVGPASLGQPAAQGPPLPPVSVQQPQFVSAPPPPSIQMASQPFAPTAFMVSPSGPPTTHSPSAFGMIPGDSWNWKIGDLCLAKYWDDGRYYEAEITGFSDKTCVVLFLGYGNHEEVLKSDCLPITDAQNRTINFSNSVQHGPPVSVPTQSSMPSRGVPNRYRCERQVYIPPPKRDN